MASTATRRNPAARTEQEVHAADPIVKAETVLVSIPFESVGTPPWSFGGKPRNAFDTLMVRLETESGLTGWGEAFSRHRDRNLNYRKHRTKKR